MNLCGDCLSRMAEKNILVVTGANGFLGRAILSQLQASDISVRATDLGATGSASNIIYRKADITSQQELNAVLENATTVIHAAGLAHIFSLDANSAENFRQINEIGTANVASVAAAVGVGHFIQIGSVSVYGPYTHGIYDENMPCNPVGAYALSKYNAELRAIEIARESGMALTILRLATLYGEGDSGNIGRLIRSLDKGRFVWIGDGSNRKSLLYKGDAARACVTVALSPAAGTHIYNVSSQPCTIREIVDGIADALEKRPLPLRIPKNLALALSRNLSKLPNRRLSGIHQTVQKWMAEDVYDTSRFERDYQYCSQVGVREGLRREVEWYRNRR
jgi:nucleoside-diphosphate-sugar epimerase